MGLTNGGKWAIVVSVETVIFASCCIVTYLLGTRKAFTDSRLAIAHIGSFLSAIVVIPLIVFASLQENSEKGVLTTRSWFGGGWENGLSIFSVRIDTYEKYILIVGYQIVRSFVGSIILNVFRSFLLVAVQGGAETLGSKEALTPWKVVAAQMSFDFFIFVSSIIDSMLVLSSVDLTVITMVCTMCADAMTTLFFMEANKKAIRKNPISTTDPHLDARRADGIFDPPAASGSGNPSERLTANVRNLLRMRYM